MVVEISVERPERLGLRSAKPAATVRNPFFGKASLIESEQAHSRVTCIRQAPCRVRYDKEKQRMNIRLTIAAGALIASAACSSSSSPTTPSNGSGTQVSIVSGSSALTTTAYSPNPVVVAVGGTATWKNNDNVAHTASANDGTWGSGSIAPGASFSRTFPTAGSFLYKCTIHPGMVGTVTVQ